MQANTPPTYRNGSAPAQPPAQPVYAQNGNAMPMQYQWANSDQMVPSPNAGMANEVRVSAPPMLQNSVQYLRQLHAGNVQQIPAQFASPRVGADTVEYRSGAWARATQGLAEVWSRQQTFQVYPAPQ